MRPRPRSQRTSPGPPPNAATATEKLQDNVRRVSQQQHTPRTREELARLFAGTDLVAPGIVPVERWRPVPGAGEAGVSAPWAGAGRKRD
jgi:S-adenosyl methyltransferase